MIGFRFAQGPRRGFTLLETMLAVGLSALLIALVAAALQMYTQVVANRNEEVTNAQFARAVLQQITGDLRSAIYEEPSEDEASLDPLDDTLADTADLEGDLPADETTSDLTDGVSTAALDLTNSTVAAVPGVYGNLTEVRIDVRGKIPFPLRYDTMVNAGADPITEGLLSVDRVITYYLRPATATELAGTPLEMPADDFGQDTTILVRRVQTRAEAAYESSLGGQASTQAGEQLLCDRIVALEFNYHDGYDWTDSWDSELQGGLPIAVQITITVADPNNEDAIGSIFQTRVALPTAIYPDATATTEEL